MEFIDPYPSEVDKCDYCGIFRRILFIRGNSMEGHSNVCSECIMDAVNENESNSYYPYTLLDVGWWEEAESEYSLLNEDIVKNFEWE